ncbi:MAG: hypothetical protein AB1758_17950 [Candidatus Eremiobacterota bacterium]
MLPGRLGDKPPREASPRNGAKRSISLKPSPDQPSPEPEGARAPEFKESENPLAVREAGALTISEGLPGRELLDLMEFTLQEVQDAIADTHQRLEEELSEADDPGTRIKALNRLRVVRRDLEKRIVVRMDIARLQFEELAEKESKHVVDGIGQRCRALEKRISAALDELTARMER